MKCKNCGVEIIAAKAPAGPAFWWYAPGDGSLYCGERTPAGLRRVVALDDRIAHQPVLPEMSDRAAVEEWLDA